MALSRYGNKRSKQNMSWLMAQLWITEKWGNDAVEHSTVVSLGVQWGWFGGLRGPTTLRITPLGFLSLRVIANSKDGTSLSWAFFLSTGKSDQTKFLIRLHFLPLPFLLVLLIRFDIQSLIPQGELGSKAPFYSQRSPIAYSQQQEIKQLGLIHRFYNPHGIYLNKRVASVCPFVRGFIQNALLLLANRQVWLARVLVLREIKHIHKQRYWD